jgi:hypothetical protein
MPRALSPHLDNLSAGVDVVQGLLRKLTAGWGRAHPPSTAAAAVVIARRGKRLVQDTTVVDAAAAVTTAVAETAEAAVARTAAEYAAWIGTEGLRIRI